MGGFFSSFGKGLKGLLGDGDMMSTLAAARAYSDGDYSTGYRIGALAQENKRERAKEEQKAAAIESIRSGLRARGYQDSDIDVIMANPDNASALVMEALKTRSGGAEGLTVATPDPVTGQLRTQTTAGWHDGSYFGGTDGTNAPERLYQGEKVFPVPAGGYLGVYGGPGGSAPMVGAPAAPAAPTATPPGAPPVGTVDEGFVFKGGNPKDPNNWEPVGGAGPGAPRPFPRPY